MTAKAFYNFRNLHNISKSSYMIEYGTVYPIHGSVSRTFITSARIFTGFGMKQYLMHGRISRK